MRGRSGGREKGGRGGEENGRLRFIALVKKKKGSGREQKKNEREKPA